MMKVMSFANLPKKVIIIFNECHQLAEIIESPKCVMFLKVSGSRTIPEA